MRTLIVQGNGGGLAYLVVSGSFDNCRQNVLGEIGIDKALFRRQVVLAGLVD